MITNPTPGTYPEKTMIHKYTCTSVFIAALFTLSKISVQFSSVAQSCPTLCDPMNRSKDMEVT